MLPGLDRGTGAENPRGAEENSVVGAKSCVALRRGASAVVGAAARSPWWSAPPNLVGDLLKLAGRGLFPCSLTRRVLVQVLVRVCGTGSCVRVW